MVTLQQTTNTTHILMEGMQAILLSSVVTLFYSAIDFEIMGFTAGMLLVLLLFVTIDWVTGTSASLNEGEKLSSKKGRQSVYKIISYTMAILFFAVIEAFTTKNSGVSFGSMTLAFLRSFIFSLMLLWEFHSVGENLERIFGDKPRIFYFVEVTTKMLEERVIHWLEGTLKVKKKIDEKASTEESKDSIQETKI